jgi:hypothetical protein
MSLIEALFILLQLLELSVKSREHFIITVHITAATAAVIG